MYDTAVVLGSGWCAAADALGTTLDEFSLTDLTPEAHTPSVGGHSGRVRSVAVGDKQVLVFLGRTHLYERRRVEDATQLVRIAHEQGCRTIVLTNAAGGLRSGMRVGQPVLISDHLNMTALSPLRGPHFVDMTHTYSQRLRAAAQRVDSSLEEGVYAQMPGPQYETPAEIRALRTLGADLVGMSTVLEAISARAAGMEVLGISLVSNLAAGMTGEALNHEEVLEAGNTSARAIGELLAEVLKQ